MPAIAATTAARSPTQRSRKTNGRRLFVDAGDQRSPWARRWRDLVALYADDLGAAGTLSAFQVGLVETAATLRVELERIEATLSVGGEVDIDQFGRLVGHFRRVCETLSIERRKREVVPSFKTTSLIERKLTMTNTKPKPGEQMPLHLANQQQRKRDREQAETERQAAATAKAAKAVTKEMTRGARR